MNEPKRRGRPPKVKPINARVEGGEAVCADCGQAVGHYDDCPAGMGVAREVPELSGQTVALHTGMHKSGVFTVANAAQLYAERVWNGQSPEVHREERLRRVQLALDGQGLSMEGVEL